MRPSVCFLCCPSLTARDRVEQIGRIVAFTSCSPTAASCAFVYAALVGELIVARTDCSPVCALIFVRPLFNLTP